MSNELLGNTQADRTDSIVSNELSTQADRTDSIVSNELKTQADRTDSIVSNELLVNTQADRTDSIVSNELSNLIDDSVFFYGDKLPLHKSSPSGSFYGPVEMFDTSKYEYFSAYRSSISNGILIVDDLVSFKTLGGLSPDESTVSWKVISCLFDKICEKSFFCFISDEGKMLQLHSGVAYSNLVLLERRNHVNPLPMIDDDFTMKTDKL